MSICVHRGPVGELEGGSCTGDFERQMKVCRKGSGDGHLLHRDPTLNSGMGLIYKGLRETDEGGSRNGASLSEGAV